MSDEGTPIAYTALTPETPVHDRAGRQFGTVEKVLDVPDLDVFDGLVVRTEFGLRFVDANLVQTITRAHMRCSIGPEEAQALPEPAAPPVFKADATDDIGSSLWDRLGRLFGRGRWKREQ